MDETEQIAARMNPLLAAASVFMMASWHGGEARPAQKKMFLNNKMIAIDITCEGGRQRRFVFVARNLFRCLLRFIAQMRQGVKITEKSF